MALAGTGILTVAAKLGDRGRPRPRARATSTALAPATTAPTAPTTTAAPSALTIIGVGPGVNQDPFYPAAAVSQVSCGTAPAGRFVRLEVPAGGTSSRSALAATTTMTVVPGKAVLRDHTGKVLYEEHLASIATGRAGALVLSLVSTTFVGGDGRAVSQGAVNVSGDYTCPDTDVAFGT